MNPLLFISSLPFLDLLDNLIVLAAEFVASSLLGEKSVDYVDDQRDYSHCVNHPESTRGERPAHWTNREGWDKDQKPPPKATDTTV